MTGVTISWPEEKTNNNIAYFPWFHDQSNILLDFHGNPNNPQLTVLSDGNHHMALQETLQDFSKSLSDVENIFYVTLPPRLLKNIIETGGIQVGNIDLTINADIILSPPKFLQELSTQCYINCKFPFVKNQGCVLLIRNGNPKNIHSVEDLCRDDINLFISNPITESVSHNGYRDTLIKSAAAIGLDGEQLAKRIDNEGEGIVYGNQIHHREAPQLIASGECDIAIVYYHLALRYTRIFPREFDFIPMGGSKETPSPGANNTVSSVDIALLNDNSVMTENLIRFLKSTKALEIYHYHGLLPV